MFVRSHQPPDNQLLSGRNAAIQGGDESYARKPTCCAADRRNTPLKEPVDPGLGELGESSWETDLWDAFLPDDGPEPQPEQGDFWIERGIE